jgi:hypothetical protein
VPNQIGHLTSGGAVSYPITKTAGLMSFNPGPLTRGPDGLNGAFTLFGGIALGCDGNFWFTSYYDGLIGRVTPAGVITEFTGVAPNAQLNAITAGRKSPARTRSGSQTRQQEDSQADASLALTSSGRRTLRSCA